MKKSVAAALMSLIATNVVCLGTLSFAWFTARQKVENGTSNIVAIKEELVEDVKFYAFDQTQRGTKTQYYFDSTPISGKDLGKYSIINSGYQLLVEIDLVSTLDVSVIAETEAEAYLGNVSINEDGSVNYTLTEKGNSLSSIVCFYGFAGENVALSEDGSYFSVDLADSSLGKKNLINDDYTDLLPSKSNRVLELQDVDKVFVVIDYDEFSIETIYSANLGNDVTSGLGDDMVVDDEGHKYIEYVADFKLVVRKVVSNE